MGRTYAENSSLGKMRSSQLDLLDRRHNSEKTEERGRTRECAKTISVN